MSASRSRGSDVDQRHLFEEAPAQRTPAAPREFCPRCARSVSPAVSRLVGGMPGVRCKGILTDGRPCPWPVRGTRAR
jgi:hypothetical protein